MEILVCMSVVPDTTTKITFSDNNKTLNKTGVQYIINPYCELALSKAIELSEKHNANVTVIHVGGNQNDPIIRKALAMGAHQAIRVDAEPKDGQFVAREIAEYAKTKSFDLILSGRESIDFNSGMVGNLVAAYLDLEHANVVTELDVDDNNLICIRDIDGGREKLAIKMPASASAQKDLIEPKIPNMRGIMQARTKPLHVIAPSVAENVGNIQNYELPKGKQEVKLFDTDEVANLIDVLKNDKKLF